MCCTASATFALAPPKLWPKSYTPTKLGQVLHFQRCKLRKVREFVAVTALGQAGLGVGQVVYLARWPA